MIQMYEGGYISLYRSILNWDWYTDTNTKSLFIHLILTANYLPGNWKGKHVGVGQRITSLTKLSQELNLSVKEVRTALRHLQETGEVACETNPQHTVITIKNYVDFQSGARQRANAGQTRGTQKTAFSKKNRKNGQADGQAEGQTGKEPEAIENTGKPEDGNGAEGKRRGTRDGKPGANAGHAEGQQYNNIIKKKRNKYIAADDAAAPFEGAPLPPIGEGPCELELDGILHRFPKIWYEMAEAVGEPIEDYVKRRHL